MKAPNKARTLLISCATVIFAHGQIQAALVVDFSPDTTGQAVGNPSYQNLCGTQILGDLFTLTGDTTIAGAAIFSTSAFGTVGDNVRLLIFDDAAGVPAATPTIDLTSVLDAVDTLYTTTVLGMTRKHATFTPTLLTAGTYWFSMSGLGQNIAQGTDNFGGFRVGATDLLTNTSSAGDLYFQLESAWAVPQTSSALLFGLGAVGLCMRCRRH